MSMKVRIYCKYGFYCILQFSPVDEDLSKTEMWLKALEQVGKIFLSDGVLGLKPGDARNIV